MGKLLSLDLRQRVLAFIEEGHSCNHPFRSLPLKLSMILFRYQATSFSFCKLDLSRNCAAPLTAYCALKEKRDGITTYSRI